MTPASYWRLVRRNRNFRLLWCAQIVSELGDWFYSIAIFTLLLETTGRAELIAFAFILQTLPQTLIAPSAGVINDRISRKKVMIFADLARACITLCMLLVTSGGRLWLLFGLLFFETTCWGLFEPGRSAVIPNITAKGEVPLANALSSSTWSVIFAVGAAFGGIATVTFGRPTVFVLNSLSFVGSAILISRMRFAEPHAEDTPPLRFRDLLGVADVVEGFRYIRSDRRLLATVFVKGGLGLLGANWVILPVLGERMFPLHLAGLSAQKAGTLGVSALFGARGIGALIGAAAASGYGGVSETRSRRVIVVGFAMAAAGYFGLGLAWSLSTAALALLIAHTGASACWTSSTLLLQQFATDRFRGRVFSAEAAGMTTGLALSSFTAGKFIDAGANAQTVSIAMSLVMILPFAAWTWASARWQPAATDKFK